MPNDPGSLWESLSAAGDLDGRRLWDADAGVSLGGLREGSSLSGRLEELRGRSVLLGACSQLSAALALAELDGLVRRVVLCPPDLPPEHLPYVVATADVDAIVSEGTAGEAGTAGVGLFVPCGRAIVPGRVDRARRYATEWILMTSGTTGVPKMVVHTLASLSGAIKAGRPAQSQVVWSTFYDIRRYGGLQILLRALLGGASLVLSNARETPADFLRRAAAHGVTHILGTPTHWRTALMSPAARGISPRYVRLSGEIADQAVLDHLRAFYPEAAVVHAYASTEAGVGFEVSDGLAGFPASLAGQSGGDVMVSVVDGALRLRSSRTAARYLGDQGLVVVGADGFVDTGDMVELRGDRYYFVGRRGGIINVGGQKVHPEEVEGIINSHPRVRMSLVRAKKSSFTGALVVADVMLNEDDGRAAAPDPAIAEEILRHCRAALPRHKVPAAINVVSSLPLSATGKIERRNA